MKITAIITVAAFAAASHAGLISETENNNTMALANDIGTFNTPGGAVAVDGLLTEGDVDWFSFTINQEASSALFSMFAPSGSDGVMQIVTAGGDVIAFDDDSGVGLMPIIELHGLAAGTYFIGVSGFGDADPGSVGTDDLVDGLLVTGGQHSENFGYKLSVGFSVVPSPGATALLGMGGILMTRRRR